MDSHVSTPPLPLLVPAGRLVCTTTVRTIDSRNVSSLFGYWKQLYNREENGHVLLSTLRSTPVASVCCDFLEVPAPEGPGLTVPLKPGDSIPSKFGCPDSRIYFVKPEPLVQYAPDNQLTGPGMEPSQEARSSATAPFPIDVIDGAHRLGALTLLIDSAETPNVKKDTLVLVNVTPVADRDPVASIARACFAAQANSSLASSRTFAYDGLYALVAIRDASLQTLSRGKLVAELREGDGDMASAAFLLSLPVICIQNRAGGKWSMLLKHSLPRLRNLEDALGAKIDKNADFLDLLERADRCDYPPKTMVLDILQCVASLSWSLGKYRKVQWMVQAPGNGRLKASLEGASDAVRSHLFEQMTLGFPKVKKGRKGKGAVAAAEVPGLEQFLAEVRTVYEDTAECKVFSETGERAGRGVKSEARAYTVAYEILPWPTWLAAQFRRVSVAEKLLDIFPEGLSSHGLPQTLSVSVLKGVASKLSYSFVDPNNQESGASEGEDIATNLDSWNNRIRNWKGMLQEATLAQCHGVDAVESKGDEMGPKSSKQKSDTDWSSGDAAFQSVASRVSDPEGWSFAFFMGLMTVFAIRHPPLPKMGEDVGMAVLGAWTQVLKVLGFNTLSAAISPYLLLKEYPENRSDKPEPWHFEVPSSTSRGPVLAPRTYAVTLGQVDSTQAPAGEVKAGASLDHGTAKISYQSGTTNWAESLGPIVRKEFEGGARSESQTPGVGAQEREADIARQVVRDVTEAMLGEKDSGGCVITVTGLLGKDAPAEPTDKKAKAKVANNRWALMTAQTRNTLLVNSAQPSLWDESMQKAVVAQLLKHPLLGHFNSPDVRNALLSGKSIHGEPVSQENQQQQQPVQGEAEAGAEGEKEEQQSQAQVQVEVQSQAQLEEQSQAQVQVQAQAQVEPQAQAQTQVGVPAQSQSDRPPQEQQEARQQHEKQPHQSQAQPQDQAPTVLPTKRKAGSDADLTTAVSRRRLSVRPEFAHVESSDVVDRVVAALQSRVLILKGDATSVAECLDVDEVQSISTPSGFRERVQKYDLKIVSDDMQVFPRHPPTEASSGIPLVYGQTYAGVQLLLTDPPYGVRAGERTSERTQPTEARTHDTALSLVQIEGFFKKLTRAAALWARSAVIVSESLVGPWKEGMLGSATGHAGSSKSLPECIVLCYEEPPKSGNRRRGANASDLLRTTEFVVQAKLGAVRKPVSRARSNQSSGENPGSGTGSVNLAGWNVYAGSKGQARDMSHLCGIQRVSEGELIRREFSRAFVRNAAEQGGCEEELGDEVGPTADGARAARYEQKSEWLIAELLARFCPKVCTRGTVVLDPFAGTLTTALAALTLSEATVVVSDTEEDVLEVGKARLLVRALYLALVGGGTMGELAKTREDKEAICLALAVAVRNTARGDSLRRQDWGSLPGGDGPLPLFPTMPNHMWVHFSRRLRQPPNGHAFAGPMLFAAANKACRADEDFRAAAYREDASNHGLRVDISGRPGAGLGVFATKRFSAGDSIAPFYGAYSYASQTRKKRAEVAGAVDVDKPSDFDVHVAAMAAKAGGAGSSFLKKRYDGIVCEGSTTLAYGLDAFLPRNLPVWGTTGHVTVTPGLWTAAAYVNDPREEKQGQPDEAAANVTVVEGSLQWLRQIIDADSDDAAERAVELLSAGPTNLEGCDPEWEEVYYNRKLESLGWKVSDARRMPLLATREFLLKPDCVELVAKRAIAEGEELFFNYGPHHDLNG